MTAPVDLIAARTHSGEYLLHKYWSRKPANVISHFLGALVPRGGIVIDPFCGSGVALREAIDLGIDAYGFDINPIACLISRTLVDPPPVEAFTGEIEAVLGSVSRVFDRAYGNKRRGWSIRWVVHEMVVACPECGRTSAAGDAEKRGRRYTCRGCGCALRYNLSSMVSTRIVGAVTDSSKRIVRDRYVLGRETGRSRASYYGDSSRYDHPFCENRRILTFAGMTTKHLFTERNFSLVAMLADRFRGIGSKDVSDAALMLLTSSVAQCSRLIPSRNNLTSGGPAWSVPGYWVPPVHLETNLLHHLRARFQKFKRGLSALHERAASGKARVEACGARKGLAKLVRRRVKADLVFLDPPYGDSVPFLEFSALWNGFLGDRPGLELDVSVSDRGDKEKAWTRYSSALCDVLARVGSVLKEEGTLLLTFNNHDLRAWNALLGALQGHGYICFQCTYQIPPVVPSKAQFSPEGSYISDIYSSWRRSRGGDGLSRDLSPVVSALERCSLARGGSISLNLALRTCMLEWVTNNIAAGELDRRDALVEDLFERDGLRLTWTGSQDSSIPDLSAVALTEAKRILSSGPCRWSELYERVARKVLALDIGIPDPGELRLLLEGAVVVTRSTCVSIDGDGLVE